MVKLNLGCGTDIMKGYINIDHINFEGVDIVMDLNKLPYNFKDNSIDRVYMKDVIEHLDNPFKVIEELHRIIKRDGYIYLELPHFTSASNYNDPTHKTRFGYQWFQCFGKNYKHLEYLTTKKFGYVKIELCFGKKLILKPLSKFFTKYNKLYEYTPLRVIPCTRLIVIMIK